MFYDFLPHTLQYLIMAYLWHAEVATYPTSLKFELRQTHGLVPNSSRIVFSDASALSLTSGFEVRTMPVVISKPVSQTDFFSARLGKAERELLQWDETETTGPDVHDRESLRLLAQMTNNAYSQPGEKDWYDLGPDWNNTYPFGWEPDADGLRGHVFANEDNSTVVISVKGTSAGWVVGGGGPTTGKDKLNDNLLFSCCCARVGPTWSTVCPCYSGSYKCDQGCLERSLTEESLFYSVGINLYNNVTYMYPDANIWITGHSLGGSLASLIGATFGAPVVAFEAPAERLAASRLHLPSPPSLRHITHVYHTADPVPMGVCTGYGSLCTAGGFAFETQCHLGQVIRYDTVSQLRWSVSLRTHSIAYVIENLLSEDWEGAGGGGVPGFYDEADCSDCYQWEFGDFRDATERGCS